MSSPRPSRRRPVRLRLLSPDAGSRAAVTALGVPPLGGGELIGLRPADARHHVHIPGPTGTGKSTLLLNTVISHARAGRGVAVFDPKGDLIRDLLERLPLSVAGRLVLIDPDEKEAPAALNLFDVATDPEQVADHLVGVMAKVWAQYWGPRTDDLARHAVLTLAHLPGSTLADLPPLLADTVHRRYVLAAVRRRISPLEYAALQSFWAWYDDLSPAQASTQIGPLLSKLRAVLSRRFAADLFGTAASTFTLPDILDGGVLLVRLPPSLEEDTVRLTGSLLLAALLHAAAARTDQPETDRLDATLVLDECHTFLNLPVGVDDALAVSRALHVSLWLAHQHLDQLTPKMAAAIDANARNKVFFALPPKDARALAHHVGPHFEAEDLMHRDAYGIVCRLIIHGRDGEPFSLTTRPAPPSWPGRAGLLRAAARARGLPQSERDVLAQARRLGPAAPSPDRKPRTGQRNLPPVPAPPPAHPSRSARPGGSPGVSPGGSLVPEPPTEPPTPPHPTPQVKAPTPPPTKRMTPS